VPEQPISAEEETDLSLEIAHLLFIDVVGYSKRLVNEQIELIQLLNRVVRATESFRRAEAKGRLIRLPTGDGMVLLFFRSPEEPVRCALEISEALRDQTHLRLRMGIHSGPVNQVTDVNDQLNMAGVAMNIGQRVMDCGDAGHILISKHVADDLAGYAHWRPYLHDLGECEVKHGLRLHLFNLAKGGLGNPLFPEKFSRAKRWKPVDASRVRPVRPIRWPKSLLALALALSAVALAISFWIFTHRGALPRTANPNIPEKSIAVLPFENRSEDKSNAYFADGIQDEILTRLSKIADLKVISRTSTQHYKSTPENLREIGKELGVAHIVEGSVQKSGDAVRVNVQLIKAANDFHVWADTFDRKLTDILSVESEVAKTIADQLQAKLTGQEEQVIAAKPTDNPDAYDAYLRGLAYTLKAGGVTPANSLGAQKYLRDAVRIDPKFALGWALLSLVDSRGYITAALQPTIALRDEARHTAETALTLQPNLGEALYATGYFYYACPKDYDTAVRYFEQARQFLPNGSRIPESLAYVARRRGEWDKSETYFNEAGRLDPRNVNLLRQHAASYVALRRFAQASRKLDQVLNITPDDVDTLAQKAGILQAEGDLPGASALLAPLRLAADDPIPLAAQAYQAMLEHRPAQFISRLEEILRRPDPAMGYLNGELRFFLGWAQQVAGDRAGSQTNLQQSRTELESLLKEQPENYALIGFLALSNAYLGDKAAALKLSERAMAALPVERDALVGPLPIDIFARVAANVGEHDRSIAALQKLLSIPYAGPFPENVPLTPALLRLDPMFNPLRGDPRFEKLINSSTSPGPNK
jgi:TolB-like protein/class 3 adenylate cyclase/Tfp pilus assembly protein PilF